MNDSRFHPNSHPNALEHSADHGVSRLDFEYHWLRRRLVELHSSEQKNPAAIDAVMRKLDETRSAVHAAHPQLAAGTSVHAATPAPR